MLLIKIVQVWEMKCMFNCLKTVNRWVPNQTALNLKILTRLICIFNASLTGCAAG